MGETSGGVVSVYRNIPRGYIMSYRMKRGRREWEGIADRH